MLRQNLAARLPSALAAAALLAAAGCGGGPTAVQGTVTSKGKTVHAGTISLHAGQVRRDGAITQDGTFQIVDVAPGEYKVTVETPTVLFKAAPGAGPKTVIPGQPKSEPPPPPVPVDPKYKTPATSDVTVVVQGGAQKLAVELK